MAIQLQKAKRTMAKVKIAIGGISGSGKTMSSLLLAYGLVKGAHPDWPDADCWDKICILDTENGSASLYVNKDVGTSHIGEYFTIPMTPPYDAQHYIDAIHAAEGAGMEVIIIDSLSPAWAGVGGSLDKQGKIAARTGNSYTAWRDVTPEHNRLVDTILQSPAHVLFCMRAKQEYVQTKDSNGKTVVKNVGMGLVMREGIEYESSICFMIDGDHVANATKDRTGMFDGKYFTITPETGKEIYRWLASGSPEPVKPAEPVKASAPAPDETLTKAQNMVTDVFKAKWSADGADKDSLKAQITEILGVFNPKDCTDIDALRKAYAAFK